MANLEEMLKKNLHRVTCPDPIEVGEYHLGYLNPDRSRWVQEHLIECPYCRNEFSILKNYLNLLHADLHYSVSERIKIWIARLLPAPAPGLQLAFAVRGEQNGGPARYEIGDGVSTGELNLETQDDLEVPGRKMLVGLVLGIASQDLQAGLWQAGSLVAEGDVDEFGNLAVANLAKGSYDLILSGRDFEIHVQGVQV